VDKHLTAETTLSRFHLTLPSNSSMNYYSENTVARFTTKLPNNIDLDGEWDVGLSEISVPSHVHNVIEGLCFYDIYMSNTFIRRINPMPGQYRRMRELFVELHRAQREQIPLQSHEPLLVEFSYESDSGKVKMTYLASAPRRVQVEFSLDLARLLGYSHNMRYGQRYPRLSKYPPDLRGRVHSVYVYCDVLEHVPVGDTKAPLLRIVDTDDKSIGNIHRVFNPLLYVPLQKKTFNTIDIDMRTDFGTTVPFLSGKSFVLLEFRPVFRPYFSI